MEVTLGRLMMAAYNSELHTARRKVKHTAQKQNFLVTVKRKDIRTGVEEAYTVYNKCLVSPSDISPIMTECTTTRATLVLHILWASHIRPE